MRCLILAASAACAWIATTGCTALADAKSAKGSGTVRTYGKPCGAVWDAAAATVKGARA